ncbi:hypothetical protein NDU88_004947 [Pleurodeles waltl]|uniref:Uncharacterized protein n=1 Tax=Pleurodeles waltl TaxID=8319 RepID=A0AAV7M8I7_PLEWA|nr:hypothetical protein NDU88_004947 [Pleurodeles waltl]
MNWVNNSPTTLHAEAGAELRSDALSETASDETGNPDVQVPVNVPAEGRRAEKTEEEKTAGAGNPKRARRGRRGGHQGARNREGRTNRQQRKRGGKRAKHWGVAAV